MRADTANHRPGDRPRREGRRTPPPPPPPVSPPGPDEGGTAPPRELAPDATESRRFEADGREWLARISGKSAGGTGASGLGMLQAVHFFDAADPDTPRFEALLPRGRFDGLFDEELRALLKQARPIVDAATRDDATRSRRNG